MTGQALFVGKLIGVSNTTTKYEVLNILRTVYSVARSIPAPYFRKKKAQARLNVKIMSNQSDANTPITKPEAMNRLTHFKNSLSAFASSDSTFKILASSSVTTKRDVRTVKPFTHTIEPLALPPKAIHILDSSFNPPTLAHYRIALASLISAITKQNLNHNPRRLVLLLATQNADKSPKPASFEERLAMMEDTGKAILEELARQGTEIDVGVDIAVTKHPYFVDKSKDIEKEESYNVNAEVPEQVHLIGYDTVIRLLSPKYYPPNHTLESLVPFLEKHRLEITYRTDDCWGGKKEQDGFIDNMSRCKIKIVDGMATTPSPEEALKDSSLEKIGGKREWVTNKRIVMVGGRKEGEEIVSSTRVREAFRNADQELLDRLLLSDTTDFIRVQALYQEH